MRFLRPEGQAPFHHHSSSCDRDSRTFDAPTKRPAICIDRAGKLSRFNIVIRTCIRGRRDCRGSSRMRLRRCGVIWGNFISRGENRDTVVSWLRSGREWPGREETGERFFALTERATLRARCYFRWKKMLVTLIEGSWRRAERDRHYCYYLPCRDGPS